MTQIAKTEFGRVLGSNLVFAKTEFEIFLALFV